MIEREGVRPVALWCRRHGALLAMVGVLMVTAWVASRVHHPGHAWGDDFSLYLRQAKGIVEGNASQVVGDNHFTVTTSGRPLFSPLIYPWGFPMMLSVFYKAFGMNYLQLKMGMVIIFCGYLWFFHLVLRRRMNQWVALATATAMATSLAYLRHTDYLLSELPYMFAAAVALWWLDHCRRKSRLHEATRHELIVLGVLAMYVFNTRREGLAFIIAVGAVQLWDLRGQSRTANWWRVGTPFMSFVGSLVLLQLLLPSSLAPDTEKAGLGQTWKKLTGPWHRDFASQLGIPSLHGFWLFVVFAIAIAGLLWRLVTATRDDLGIAVFAVLSMTIVGMIDANSIRYLMSITPWALYFGVQALSALRVPRKERTRQFGPIIAAAAMVLLVVH
ncbi:MAG: hypothetical protein WCI22_02675, partial [Actinomycetota bacterium]